LKEDFRDLLAALLDAEARFLVVGAHALAVHGVPRATGDLDVWVDPEASNAVRVWSALQKFGAPLEQSGVCLADLQAPAMVVQIGLPPRRIDVLTEVSGLAFEEAWGRRAVHTIDQRDVPFLGRADLIRNKRASGRAKDLADVDTLEGR
jgi:hypothetical protein